MLMDADDDDDVDEDDDADAECAIGCSTLLTLKDVIPEILTWQAS